MNTEKRINSLEIAEMLEMEHKVLLRKLEGSKDRKGYIEILGEHQMVPSEFFTKDIYMTSQNKEMPCYQFTKLGCDFIANKFNGEKGILFTAKYVKRFNEMETTILQAPQIQYLNGLANLMNSTRRTMKDQGSSPQQIAKQIQLLCNAYNVPLIENFIEPTHEQVALTLMTTQTQLTLQPNMTIN